MAANRNLPKCVAVLAVLAVLAAAGSSVWVDAMPEPLGGFGSFLGTSDSSSTPAPSSGSDGGFVDTVLGAFGAGPRRPASQPPPHQHHRAPATTTTTTTSTTTTTTTTTARYTPSSRATTPAATTAAPHQTTTAMQRHAVLDSEEHVGERSGASSLPPGQNKEICMKNWHDVGNETVNNNIDVLPILLDHGGVPGQVPGLKWERNTTNPLDPNQPDPDRWSYFYGDTDYKTYVRVERGSVHSKESPSGRTVPEEVRGDIWWEPKDFCGKMRHAKYYMWALHCENQTAGETCKVLSVIDNRDFYKIVKVEGREILCAGEACDFFDDNRGPGQLSGGLLAALVGAG